MTDLEQKNKNLDQNSAPSPAEAQKTQPEKTAEKKYDDPHLQELHDNRFEKKGARRAFHAVNFLGLHQIFNNVTSVIITYKMATTGFANKMKDSMATTGIGKGLSTVLSAPNKVVNGIFKLFGKDPHKGLMENEIAALTHKSQRQAIETAFMCVAGFIALAPVYYLEKHRAGFLNTVDNWLHPGRKPEEKKAAALTKEDEPKETLWNLVRARLIALAVVFGVDQARDNIDNILKRSHEIKNKPGIYKNVDTVFGWGLGNKIYDKLPSGMRGWLAGLFSGKDVTLGSIQDETLPDVLKVIKAPAEVVEAGGKIAALAKEKRLNFNNKILGQQLKEQIAEIDKELVAKGHFNTVERAVFSEQSRLFITKEVFLTTILSAVIYFCAKSPTALKFMEKIGLAKKGSYEKEHAKLEARRHSKHTADKDVPSPESEPQTGAEKNWTAGKEKRDVTKGKTSAASFTEAAVNSQTQEAAASLG